jgi:hypothetical protein
MAWRCPDEVLKNVYYSNALRIVPGVRERYEAYVQDRKPKSGGH